jgi:hypothetical protein
MLTEGEDYRACLEAVALLDAPDPDAAIAVLEPLLTQEGCRCRGEAAFLLGLARLAQDRPDGVRHRAAAEAFAIAADQEHSVYASAAAYRYATLFASMEGEAIRTAWQRVVDTSPRAYGPVAHFAIGHSLHQDGLDAERSMTAAFVSGDPEYAPKAAVWLLEQAAHAGQEERAQRIATIINPAFGPAFIPSDFEYHEWQVPLLRRQLLDPSSPIEVVRAADTLAQLDDVTDSPTITTMLIDHLRAQKTGQEVKPLFDATKRPPWWASTVSAHEQQGTLHELAYDLFWVIDRVYAHPAIAYVEGEVEDAEALVSNIVHTMDEFSWGPLLHEDFRQRINLVLQAEILPPGWPYKTNGKQAKQP